MGGFEAVILVAVDPSVKYHSAKGYILTCPEKTDEDSIWWVVLCVFFFNEKLWALLCKNLVGHLLVS